jgi:hypothetical protein
MILRRTTSDTPRQIWWKTVDTSRTSSNVNLFTIKRGMSPINILHCIHLLVICN